MFFDSDQYRMIDISYLVVPGADPERPFEMARSLLADDSFKYDITKTHTHVGSHVECSAHFFEDGKSVDEYPCDAFYGRGVLLHVDLPDEKYISASYIDGAIGDILRPGDIVVCRSARQSGLENKRFFATDAAEYFRDRNVKMIVLGPNVSMGESVEQGRRFHDILMEKTTFLEFVSGLEKITKCEFYVMALPVLVKGLDSSWCRPVVIEKR